MNFKPLEGVRVLDLTSVVVGPVCTARLAQYGAEVIKLESPDGDLMRGLGGLSPTGQHSGAYLHLNRGKRNLCCDLKKPGSKALIEKLVGWADVIIANMRPQALARLGLDAQTIRSKHPDKVYCLITGYGTDGPYAGHPTYDSVVQAVTGMTGLMLARDGAPAYVPMLICDHVVGEIASGSILAAIIQRTATGNGSTIEVPMFETMAAFVLQEHLAQQSFDPPVGPPGDLRLLSPHNKPVKTADGWIAFTVNTDQQVRSFLRVVGREELIGDPRFATVAARAENVKEWFEVRGAPLTHKTTAEWLEILQGADIAVKPCHTLDTLQRDPHLQAVGLLQSDDHPTEGKTVAIRSTISFDDAYPPLRSFAQPRGWDTCAVLEEMGYSADQIAALIEEGTAVPASSRESTFRRR
ncbi:CoA transferase [Pandoraea sp. XJJ-1]|uniref:CaiB/BaiF CoA transferase family protein n=1 Tax=Pandoraea sp. XJJ-1 TaxID=3002643 RepID=UPI00227DDDEE|nr:CoA transferase [Pandoraea sp. XJJ-1]WAL84005.1 CoA transferase [Pandoraea sp. XJJ-1]